MVEQMLDRLHIVGEMLDAVHQGGQQAVAGIVCGKRLVAEQRHQGLGRLLCQGLGGQPAHPGLGLIEL